MCGILRGDWNPRNCCVDIIASDFQSSFVSQTKLMSRWKDSWFLEDAVARNKTEHCQGTHYSVKIFAEKKVSLKMARKAMHLSKPPRGLWRWKLDQRSTSKGKLASKNTVANDQLDDFHSFALRITKFTNRKGKKPIWRNRKKGDWGRLRPRGWITMENTKYNANHGEILRNWEVFISQKS